ncbi:hypothetical protein HJFPF1_01911 [Paramyrothecium foliicola]|nr:hypothetical protein HJFPF1_01911 [Paramyrothecium foliicola]
MSTPTSPVNPRRWSRDTGFPEPLDGSKSHICKPLITRFGSVLHDFIARNTTLPHPDADLSPDACISQEHDVSTERAFKRSRRPFRSRRKRTVSHGFLGPHTEAIQSMMSLSLMEPSVLDSQEVIEEETPKASSPTTTSSARFSKDGQDSAASFRARSDYTPPSSPEPSEQSRRKGFFNKLRRR